MRVSAWVLTLLLAAPVWGEMDDSVVLSAPMNTPYNAMGVRVVGRTRRSSSPSGLEFDNVGTTIECYVTGTEFVGLHIAETTRNKYAVFVDGVKHRMINADSTTQQYVAMKDMDPSTTYHVEIIKATEALPDSGRTIAYNGVVFIGLSTSDEATLAPSFPEFNFRMLFLGDGIVTGMGINSPAGQSCTTEDEYLYTDFSDTFSFRLCRLMNAECHYVAATGWGVDRTMAGDRSKNMGLLVQQTLASDQGNADWDNFAWRPHMTVIIAGWVDFNGDSPIRATEFNFKLNELATAMLSWSRSSKGRVMFGCGPMSGADALCTYMQQVERSIDVGAGRWDIRSPVALGACRSHPSKAVHDYIVEHHGSDFSYIVELLTPYEQPAVPTTSARPSIAPPSATRTPTGTPSSGASTTPSETSTPAPSESPSKSLTSSVTPTTSVTPSVSAAVAPDANVAGDGSASGDIGGSGGSGGSGSVVGLTVGLVLAVGLAAGVAFFLMKRKQKKKGIETDVEAGDPTQVRTGGGRELVDSGVMLNAPTTLRSRADDDSRGSKRSKKEKKRSRKSRSKSQSRSSRTLNDEVEGARESRESRKSHKKSKKSSKSRTRSSSRHRSRGDETPEEREARRAKRRASKAAKSSRRHDYVLSQDDVTLPLTPSL